MKKIIIFFVAASVVVVTTNVFASTWYYVSVNSDDTAYYFDSETVEKSHNNVRLWLKIVQKTMPALDGSSSIDVDLKINCKNRTLQTLTKLRYDSDDHYIGSVSNNPATEKEVSPDSIDESLLKIACEPNFPNDVSGKKYVKLKNGVTPSDINKLSIFRFNSQPDKAL